MVFSRSIFRLITPVFLQMVGLVLGVIQFMLGIEFILTGIEVENLAIQILTGG